MKGREGGVSAEQLSAAGRGTKLQTRRIPLSRRSHVIGWHPVRPGHGMVPFESALERDFISLVSGLEGFIRIVSQPFTVSFRHRGLVRRYTPDFLVEFLLVPSLLLRVGGGLRTIVEVKYAADAERELELVAARLTAASVAAGCPAILFNDVMIRGQ